MTVPQPNVAQVEPITDDDSLLNDEFGAGAIPQVARPPAAPRCPTCGAELISAGASCIVCDPPRKKPPSKSTGVKKVRVSLPSLSSLGAGPLVRGISISAIGAFVGAVAWVFVAVLTHRQIGWIAWGVGAAAGAGMAAGYGDKGDGTVPGILAGFISLGGIVLGKLFIAMWLVHSVLSPQVSELDFNRVLLAGQMASDTLKQRKVDADTPTGEAMFERESEIAMKSLEKVSDQEVEQRVQALFPKKVGDQQPQAAGAPANGARASTNVENVRIKQVSKLRATDLLGEMFGPIDGLFILIAFATAYKLGSGGPTD